MREYCFCSLAIVFLWGENPLDEHSILLMGKICRFIWANWFQMFLLITYLHSFQSSTCFIGTSWLHTSSHPLLLYENIWLSNWNSFSASQWRLIGQEIKLLPSSLHACQLPPVFLFTAQRECKQGLSLVSAETNHTATCWLHWNCGLRKFLYLNLPRVLLLSSSNMSDSSMLGAVVFHLSPWSPALSIILEFQILLSKAFLFFQNPA